MSRAEGVAGSSIAALVAGTVFGAGLATAEMTNPAKVLSFLDVAGAWDPSLGLVMAAALAVMAAAWLRTTPPPAREIDARLLGGAALFGLGWGLAGLCPGPAIAALSTGRGDVALFAASLIAGAGLFRFTLGASAIPDPAPVAGPPPTPTPRSSP